MKTTSSPKLFVAQMNTWTEKNCRAFMMWTGISHAVINNDGWFPRIAGMDIAWHKRTKIDAWRHLSRCVYVDFLTPARKRQAVKEFGE